MAKKKTIRVDLPVLEPKGKVNKFVVEGDPRESTAAVKNIYISKTALKELGNPNGVRVTIEALEEGEQ